MHVGVAFMLLRVFGVPVILSDYTLSARAGARGHGRVVASSVAWVSALEEDGQGCRESVEEGFAADWAYFATAE